MESRAGVASGNSGLEPHMLGDAWRDLDKDVCSLLAIGEVFWGAGKTLCEILTVADAILLLVAGRGRAQLCSGYSVQSSGFFTIFTGAFN